MIGQFVSFSLMQLGLLAANPNNKPLFLAMGVATMTGGILMLLSHHREVKRVFADRSSSDALKRMETRKYRRRAATSSMIAMIGSLIAGCYWVTEKRVATLFLLMIFGLLVAITIMAIVDFMSVGLRHLVARKAESEKAILEEIVRQHHQAKEDDAEGQGMARTTKELDQSSSCELQ